MEKCLEDKGSLVGGFFVWSVALGKILIIDNLQKQHVIVVDCVLCAKKKKKKKKMVSL
jgi:hypothetical protein